MGTQLFVKARLCERPIAGGGGEDRTGGLGMNARTIARLLVVVGALNWGLVGLAKFDLVATLTGNRFGETNAASRLLYLAVGAAAVTEAAEMASNSSKL